MTYTKKDLLISETLSYDITQLIVENAVEMCFSNTKAYISGIKEFAIRTNILVFLTRVNFDDNKDFKETYTNVLYGNVWNDFLRVNSKHIYNISTLREIISDAIDKYFYTIIAGD